MNKALGTIADFGAEEAAMQSYLKDGARRAFQLNNRGPIRFTLDGKLHPDILEAYRHCGFYIFEGVLSQEELGDLEADFRDMMDRFPTEQGSPVDGKGRPALGVGHKVPATYWSKPLADPFGATAGGHGRHPVKMFEPVPAADAPKEVVYFVDGHLQFMGATLRIYGHPHLLAIAAALNGDDFIPATEAIFIKQPGLGSSIAWHQDGVTHWDDPKWDEDIHGFNFMAQLYGCTPANGLWVIPGSHKRGRVDIKGMATAVGSDRLPEAVPMVCKPGDICINNRHIVHGSFANTSANWRVTVNFGFHRRASVLGVNGRGHKKPPPVYTEDVISRRARLIGYAIAARQQRFPAETPYVYKPHAAGGVSFHWDDKARADIKDYNIFDLFI